MTVAFKRMFGILGRWNNNQVTLSLSKPHELSYSSNNWEQFSILILFSFFQVGNSETCPYLILNVVQVRFSNVIFEKKVNILKLKVSCYKNIVESANRHAQDMHYLFRAGANLKKTPEKDLFEQRKCMLGGISYAKLLPIIFPILQPTRAHPVCILMYYRVMLIQVKDLLLLNGKDGRKNNLFSFYLLNQF